VKSQDIIIAGVGGQGILSLAAVLCSACARRGLHVKQSEVHGMAQRGGAVVSHIRISADPIASDLIPFGRAGLLLALEPMEGLRYLPFLHPQALLIVNRAPIKPQGPYPSEDALRARIMLWPRHVLFDAEQLAREAGTVKAVNSVMLGAVSDHLLVTAEELRAEIEQFFAAKGPEVIRKNLKAFDLGRQAGQTAGKTP
jgi:indolepyruvate ferredoxin oxidoreductase beta subunit